MTLSHDETKRLIDLVLDSPVLDVRSRLYRTLQQIKREEAEFCAGVMEHGRNMSYTSEQWVDLISKVPNIHYKNEHWLMNKLSPNQRQQLGLD